VYIFELRLEGFKGYFRILGVVRILKHPLNPTNPNSNKKKSTNQLNDWWIVGF
jgi:hypothetical protein